MLLPEKADMAVPSKKLVSADEVFMRHALRTAEQGMRQGQTPFGSCIVKDGAVVVRAHNQVWLTGDITAHAEMVAIREACTRLRTIDLSGCWLYSTCEPCPMCFSACHWARLSRVVFGAKIRDAQRAGFNELTIPVRRMKQWGQSRVQVVGNVLGEEARELFRLWQAKKNHRIY
ncbi:MAG: nucleoside deaminase [Candidatus Omnitrophica bacterium]|nr:nucleoside deaminase [Candidatus Omnitrophota bacterium]